MRDPNGERNNVLAHLAPEKPDALADARKISSLLRSPWHTEIQLDPDKLSFSSGVRGAFVLEFAVQPGISAFTIVINDQPLLPVNLWNSTFRSY